jgi:hypothetical protein
MGVILDSAVLIATERNLLIAAIAEANGHMMAAINRDEFARVMGLTLEEVQSFVL